MSNSDEETTIIILGTITAVTIFVASILFLFVILPSLDKRKKFLNTIRYFQQKSGYKTIEEIKASMYPMNKGVSDWQVVDDISMTNVDLTHVPPSVNDPNRDELLKIHHKTANESAIRELLSEQRRVLEREKLKRNEIQYSNFLGQRSF